MMFDAPLGVRSAPVETRGQGGAGFTDAVTRALLNEADRRHNPDPGGNGGA